MEHESVDYTNCNRCSWHSHQRIATGTGELWKNRTSGDHPNYCIIELGQNTEKSPGDLRRLVVTQTPVRNYYLMLLWKSLKREQMIIITKQTDERKNKNKVAQKNKKTFRNHTLMQISHQRIRHLGIPPC